MLMYQVLDVFLGYDFGVGNIVIWLFYCLGYKLVIGLDYYLLVIGKLLDGWGELVWLLVGKVIDFGDLCYFVFIVFILCDGWFGVQGLWLGWWWIEMLVDLLVIYEFEVVDSLDGIVWFGELRFLGVKGE